MGGWRGWGGRHHPSRACLPHRQQTAACMSWVPTSCPGTHRLETACPIFTKAGPSWVSRRRSLAARASVSACALAPRLVSLPSISQLPSAALICSVRVTTATGRVCRAGQGGWVK